MRKWKAFGIGAVLLCTGLVLAAVTPSVIGPERLGARPVDNDPAAVLQAGGAPAAHLDRSATLPESPALAAQRAALSELETQVDGFEAELLKPEMDQVEGGPLSVLPIGDVVAEMTRAACVGDKDINGVGTTTFEMPFATYWQDGRTTSIYLASEFACDGGPISGMKYYVTTVPGQMMSSFMIRLRHTTATEYLASPGFDNTDWTIVYGPVDLTVGATGWFTFPFDTVFNYNGVDNLEVDVTFNNASYTTYGYVYSYSTSASAKYRTKYKRCDSCACPTGGPTNPADWGADCIATRSYNVPRAQFIFPPPLTGACCVDFVCVATNEEAECAALGGSWFGGQECPAFICPPWNDDCSAVTPVTLTEAVPETFTGDNLGSTNDCSYFPGGQTWHAFELPATYAGWDVTLDYCTTTPAFGNVWLNLALGCPCTGYTAAGTYESTTCGDGNITIFWSNLAPGIYYYPVLLDPALSAAGPYTLHVVAVEHVIPPGESCGNPYIVTLPADMAPTYTDTNSTCPFLNDYADTCMGYYDGGPDVIYQLVVTEPVCLDINFTAATSTYLGWAIAPTCPLPAAGCMYLKTSGSGPWNLNGVYLPAGTYYMQVDNWPSPACVDYVMTISPAATVGACCIDRTCYQYCEAMCTGLGGTFLGVGVSCDPDPCTAGACCYGPTCAESVTEVDCVAGGGIYQGSGTTCTPNPCVGACCSLDGSCLLTTPADCTASFLGGGTVCDPNPCPQPGADCTNPVLVTLGLADLPWVDANATNCGYGDTYDYAATTHCLYYYDGGEDILYKLVVTEPMDVTLTMNPKTTTWAGFAIGNSCPPMDDCIAAAYGSAATPKVIGALPNCLHLEAGTYFIMVDTWPTPNCIPDFDLTIEHCVVPTGACCVAGVCSIETEANCATLGGTYVGDWIPCDPDPCPTSACCFWPSGVCLNLLEADCLAQSGTPYLGQYCWTVICPTPGDTCEEPFQVTLPAALPFADLHQHTCGRGNDYADTCLGSYDGGEDMIYELTVTEPLCVDISIVGAAGNNWIGLGIDMVCPLSTSCLYAFGSSSSTSMNLTGIALPPGLYYMMIDTYPAPDCLTDFNLNITASTACPTGACCDPDEGVLGCYITFEEACLYGGGVYLGDGTVCTGIDCNANGTDDECDIAFGYSQDCNGNGIPDECELWTGHGGLCTTDCLYDYDQNGVLDVCEPDCNENGVVDACDLPGGCATGYCSTATSCGTECDCNLNGIPDSCELGAKAAPRYTYMLDDGTHEDSLGITAGADLAALVSHTATSDGGKIVSVSIAWGNCAAGVPVMVYVWSDPNQDGSPADALVIGQAATVTANVDLDVFNVVTFDPPVNVGPEGTSFFIGFLINNNAYPIALDQTAPVSGRNWLVGSAYATPPIDPNDLDNTAYNVPLNTTEGVGFAGNLMIRAEGEPAGADCNANGIPDDCDVPPLCQAGAPCFPPVCSLDCNANLIPDECELAEFDCNSNGIPDDCDIAAGTSLDCQPNGIPDECDLAAGAPDCNGNTIPDECDIANCPPGETWCADCNGNGIPDECDIENCLPGEAWCQDCQYFTGDGIPDGCQLDTPRGGNLVVDPGFEAGVTNPNWVCTSTNFGTPLCDVASCGTGGGTAGPHGGSVWAWFGGCGSSCTTYPEIGTVSQTVTIPAAGLAELRFWLWNGSASGNGQDYLAAKIDGNVVFTAIEGNAAYTAGYAQVIVNVSAYADGGAHVLMFEGVQMSTTNTNFCLDDIELESMGAPANDCNTNQIPDECDIDPAYGGWCDIPPCDTDINENGIPDGCEFCGDFNNDGLVDVNDYWIFVDAFGTCEGNIKYNDACDFDGDNCITFVDYQEWLMCYQLDNAGKQFKVPPRPRPTGPTSPFESGVRPTLQPTPIEQGSH